MDDTIAAIATAPGVGAVGLLRVSGPRAFDIGEAIFRSAKAFGEIPARYQAFGKVVDASGQALDEVLLTKFPKPASYTGEDVVEIAGHGGMLVLSSLLERLIEAGARHAEGGEFTERAFLNGKMDLTQAEAVMDVISAQTSLALRAANEQLTGRLGREVEGIRQSLISILAHLEAYIDFPDEDIEPEVGAQLVARVEEVAAKVRQLASTADQGRILREGVRTVIAGSPNVGKSSLLNVLLGFDRAIVSDQAGTTRDTIEEVVNIKGIPLRLIDTAGLRGTEDIIESEGVNRARQQIEGAELVLEVFDGSLPASDNATPIELPDSMSRVIILNKADLGLHLDWEETAGMVVAVSCVKGTGMDALKERIVECVSGPNAVWGDQMVAVNARHKACLSKAEAFLAESAKRLDSGESPEFISIELRSALDAVGEVVGRTDIEEILGEIFSTFCIGK